MEDRIPFNILIEYFHSGSLRRFVIGQYINIKISVNKRIRGEICIPISTNWLKLWEPVLCVTVSFLTLNHLKYFVDLLGKTKCTTNI